MNILSSITTYLPQEPRRRARLLIGGGLLLILGWLLFKGWRIYQLARAFETHQLTANELLVDGPLNIHAGKAGAFAVTLHQDMETLQSETALFLPLTPYLGWVPKVGPAIVAAPQLLTIGNAATTAALHGVRHLDPIQQIIKDQSLPPESRLPRIFTALEKAEPDLLIIQQAVRDIKEARQQIANEENLPWQLRDLLIKMDQYLPLAEDATTLLPVLPNIMGANGRHRYLLLAQNEDELRATGGFISGAGIILVEGGRIIDITFIDANVIDDFLNKPYAFPPQPLYDYMGLELFLFRDSNYWPHFPYSAEKAIQLFQYGQDDPAPFDGVIALNQQFLAVVLKGTGPVTVPELNMTVNSQNLNKKLRDAWNSRADSSNEEEWLANRKSFMGPLSSALQTKLENEFDQIDPIYLAVLLKQAIDEKHLQIYLRDPKAAAVLATLGWDGQISNPAGQDFLMLVDTNVGYNKVNNLINTTIDYRVDLSNSSQPTAELVVHQQHNGKGTTPCTQGFDYFNITYQQMENSCHWSFLRLYTPAGSTLQNSTLHTAPASAFFSNQPYSSQAEEANDGPADFTTFAHFLLLPRGMTNETWFQYDLPPSITQSTPDQITQYSLTFANQSGSKPIPVNIELTLPAGARFVDASVPVTDTGNLIRWTTTIKQPTNVIIRYQLP